MLWVLVKFKHNGIIIEAEIAGQTIDAMLNKIEMLRGIIYKKVLTLRGGRR